MAALYKKLDAQKLNKCVGNINNLVFGVPHVWMIASFENKNETKGK